jgi:hypothetical protein
MDGTPGQRCRWVFPFLNRDNMKPNLDADRLFDPVAKSAPALSDYEKEEIAKRAVWRVSRYRLSPLHPASPMPY